MKRKNYQEPTMMVVELHHRTMLLQASGGVGAGRRSYGDADEQNWGSGGGAKELKDPNFWDD